MLVSQDVTSPTADEWVLSSRDADDEGVMGLGTVLDQSMCMRGGKRRLHANSANVHSLTHLYKPSSLAGRVRHPSSLHVYFPSQLFVHFL